MTACDIQDGFVIEETAYPRAFRNGLIGRIESDAIVGERDGRKDAWRKVYPDGVEFCGAV